MKYIKQVILILIICLIGEVIVRLLPFAFPGSVMAMLILTFLLVLKIVKEEQIRETGDFFLELLGLFIIPSSVSVVRYLDLVRQSAFSLLLLCLVGMVLSFYACAFTIRLITKFSTKKEGRG